VTDSTRPDDDTMREVVERSRSGAPAVGEAVRDRFSSDEVFQRIVAAADEEVTSGGRELFFSGVAAGLAITITFMLYVSLTAATDSHPILSVLLYPLGFIYIIIGGYQLYTENTLPPVALTLERLASLPTLLRHWGIVLAGNFTGGAFGAIVLSYGGVFSEESVVDAAIYVSSGGLDVGFWPLFFKAAMAGLIVAGVVWVGFASTNSVTRLVVVYLAFLAIPLGNLYHVVVSFTEVLYLLFAQNLGLYSGITLVGGLTDFVLPVLLGNTIGGVVLVTIVNYFQTSEERLEEARFEGMTRRLTVPEWVLGRAAGRSYVPILDATEATLFASEGHRIMVPISNPRTDGPIVEHPARERPRGRTRAHRPRRAGAGADVAVGRRGSDRRRLRGRDVGAPRDRRGVRRRRLDVDRRLAPLVRGSVQHGAADPSGRRADGLGGGPAVERRPRGAPDRRAHQPAPL
jgi:formate/nitrite transporter FocA (FNT family)